MLGIDLPLSHLARDPSAALGKRRYVGTRLVAVVEMISECQMGGFEHCVQPEQAGGFAHRGLRLFRVQRYDTAELS